MSGNGPAGTIDPHTHDGSGRFGSLELDLRYSTSMASIMHRHRFQTMSGSSQIASNCKRWGEAALRPAGHGFAMVVPPVLRHPAGDHHRGFAVQIRAITAYRLELPFRDGPYICSGGRSALGFDTLIVRVDSDEGVSGWGEMAPLGGFYDPAFPGGARAAFAELAAVLIGEDPTQLVAVDRQMDHHLKGHPYAKAAIDMACWDLLGKQAGRPLAELLGGRFGKAVDLYRSVSQGAPDKMAGRAVAYVKEGYRRIQVKVGLDPDEDIARIEAVRAAVGADVVLFADASCG